MHLQVGTLVIVCLWQILPTHAQTHVRRKRHHDNLSDNNPVLFPTSEPVQENRCVAYDGGDGVCREIGLCVYRFESVRLIEDSSCTIKEGQIGICCPAKPPPSRGMGPSLPESPISRPDITTSDLDFAGKEGRSTVQNIEQLEIELRRRGLMSKRNSPEYFLDQQFGGGRSKVREMGRDGLIGVEATLKLVRTFQLTSQESRSGLRRLSLANTAIGDTCPKLPPCPTRKYHSSDGSCNNLKYPEWGKAFHTYARVLPSRYADGISEPRAAYDGGPLPGAREVSQRITSTEDVPSQRVTVAFSVWAQFLAYDLSLTGVTTAGDGDGILCCHPEIQKKKNLLHPACMPIPIPERDPHYLKYRRNCMHFLRSVAAPRPDCTFGPREQLNQVTAYIDGSNIYGSSEERTRSLRSFRGGKLKKSSIRAGTMLPSHRSVPCLSKEPYCFRSGDVRSNQNILLSLMHVVMMREHNRLAEELSYRNPGWNDEILFQESRRIVVAELQHITYNEFLPLLLGKKVMSSYGLTTKLSGYSYDYDPEINSNIINVFATAANRFGHSLIQDQAKMIDSQGNRQYLDIFPSFDPSELYESGSYDALIRGFVRQSAQAFDNQICKPAKENLFNVSGPGLDIVALNIQRGRDHGLAGYNEWREYCGLPRLRNFEDLATVMNPAVARNFSLLYTNVDDVDLYPAGIVEYPLPDAILGPTFACLVAQQFRRLELGDRFWYENGGKESSFSEGQLQQIRKVTLSRLLCDNSNVEAMELVSFIKPTGMNPTVGCDDRKIPKMSVAAWKNEPVWS